MLFLAVCTLPCKNDGQCSEPNTCTCLDDFIGRQCEYQLCTTEPSAKNSVRNCTEDQCNITCNAGYQFADGTEVMQMTCPLGVWFPQFSSQFSNKDCQCMIVIFFLFFNFIFLKLYSCNFIHSEA